MKKKNRCGSRCLSFLLALVMIMTTAFGNAGMTVLAADSGEFIEVSVPNGDFESGETAWTFEGERTVNDGAVDTSDTYWRLFSNEWGSNSTVMYEICNHGSEEKTYTCSQKVTGLVPGIYKASVEAMGGNDGGSHKTTLTAGGKTVSVTPAKWDAWITYETETFEVGADGVCDIVIASTLKGEYVDMDNVKLWYQGASVPKTVDRVQDTSIKVQKGAAFQAPANATVLYTDGSSAIFEVVWNSDELAAVDTALAGTVFTVNGKVTVEGTEYPALLKVEILDASDLVQTVPEGAEGAVAFDENWQFYLATRTPEVNGSFAAGGVKDAGDYTTAEIVAADFNDLDWRTVDVPHDFSIEGEKVSKSVDSQAYLQGGLAYYRKKFTVPASMQGAKTISIDFEGVYQNSVVYLNGEEVGSYPSGYTGFALDVTNKLNYGGENVLVVKVQNMSPSGRWYTGSGIIRPVHLVIDNPAHFNRNGITLSAPDLEENYTASGTGYLNVQADCYSDASNSNVYMKVSVYDAEGNLAAEAETERTGINPTTAFTLSLKERYALRVPDVKLWYPWNLGDPYLYKVKVDLYTEVNGSADGYLLSDSEELEYGFRWVEVKETTNDPASGGLYVNGKYTKVQGVDLHHDSGAIGAASYTDAYQRQFEKLMAMGVNAYRTSHCPPSKQAIEVCRRNGILVVEEAFDGWGKPKASYDFGNFFFAEIPEGWAGLKPNGYTNLPESVTKYEGAKYVWSDWVIQEMVARDKNEPSIIAWSIGNEVRGCGTQPSWYNPAQYDVLGVNASKMNEYTEAVRLLRDVDAADGTRYVLMGGDQERSVPNATATWGLVNQVLDGYGLNYNTAKSVDGLINRFSIGDGTLLANATKTFFFESESSSQTSSRGVYLDPQFTNTGINQTPGSRGGSNYDNDFASWTMSNEYGLKKDRDRKSFIGQFIWTGFDYLGEPTPYGVYPVGVASFGTIDTAGFPKDSFYLYQSQWVTNPMVHLLPQNWDEWQEGENVEVWVNTNLQSAELFLNGESLGKKSFDEKETAYGKKYYETSEKTQDDKSWGDGSNPGGYTSKGAKLDEGELNSGKLHLKWDVPYTPGVLEVKAYSPDGSVAATDRVATSSTPYTILAKADKTVLAADGSSLSYVECTVVDEAGNMVPDAANLVKFSVSGAVSIFGVDNGQQESTELYKYGNTDSSSYSERTAYNGKVLVILKSGKEAGDAVLTISSDDLKPVQVALKVTEDGKGEAYAAPVVKGTEVSADPVAVTVPAGMSVTLPSAVRVHYSSNAGDYSLMKKVTWGAVTNGAAEGTIEGSSLKASAVITEDAQMATDVELATNTALGSNSNVFKLGELEGEAADYALATATFTGSVKNYPNNMLDGNAKTSWTNAYSRGASVLLPANSASRRSDYVEFYWNAKKVMNQVALSFTESKYCAIPAVLKVEYWDGQDWADVEGQLTQKASGAPVIMQFTPVYTDKIRVYMENAAPFTEKGNIEITEASVKLSTQELGAQLLLEAAEAVQGGELSVAVKLANQPTDKLIKEISFSLDYDSTVFENVAVALADGVEGTLTLAEVNGKTVYTYINAQGVPGNVSDFAVISFTVKNDAAPGNYQIDIADLSVKDIEGNAVSMTASAAAVTVKEKPIIGEVTYLSDMEWVSAVSGWKEVMKDLNCNGDNSSAIALRVNGEKQTFAKGLGVNADSEIVYNLTAANQALKKNETLYFQSYVGIDYFKTDKNQNGDGVYFIVYGDGKELYRSGKLDTFSEAERISLNVTGVTELKLVVDKIGSNSHDNGDWADAKLIRVPDPNAVDKSGLKAAIEAAEALKKNDYTITSWKSLEEALAAAKAVYENEDATKEEVTSQIAALEAAVAALKVPGAEEYQELLQKLEEKEAELAGKEEALKAAQDKVTELTERLAAAGSQVTDLTERLNQANAELERLLESSSAQSSEINILKARIAEFESQLRMAEESVELLTKELKEARLQKAALESENERLEKEVAAAREKAEQAKTEADKAKAEAEEAIRRAQEEAEKAKAEAEKAKAELEKLKDAMILKNGDIKTVNGVKYRVTDAARKRAEAYAPAKKSAKAVSVAAAVEIKGVTCKVTAIADKAFAKMTRLKKVTIGKNVTSIGKRAFYGDRKLTSITVKSKKLKTVGKQALKGISAKAVIRVPASRKTAYQKRFKGKGQKSTVKVK